MRIKFMAMMVVAALCVLPRAQAALVTQANPTSYAIPDNSPDSGAASGVYVSPANPQLSGIANPYVIGVSVAFTINGGWDSDYTLVLKHVSDDGMASQSATLFSALPYANSGFNNVTVQTGSGSLFGASSTYTTTPISGTLSGVDFSTFQNVAPTGDWILYVTDNSPSFNGTLTGWTLSMDVVPEPVNVALGIFGGLLATVVLGKKLKLGLGR
jgi:hypothetical protein